MNNETLGQENNGFNRDRMQFSETSVFFEKNVIWVFLGFIIIAIWFKFMPLIIVSVFLLLLTLIINLWKSRSLVGVIPNMELSKTRIFPGDNFTIKASIYNNKWLPLVWLEWSFGKLKGIKLGDSTEVIHNIRFLWLLWFQRVNWSLEATGIKRGVYNIGEITLCSGDGFRFAEKKKEYDLKRDIYVYPEIITVQPHKFKPSMQWGVRGKKGGIIEDPLSVIGIREYQPGDEFRKFNWRASARTGKLQVNVYQPVVVEQLIIYLDVKGYKIKEQENDDPFEYRKYLAERRASFERCLSVIASLFLKYSEQGVLIGFATNGLDWIGERIPGIMPTSNLTLIMDQLAKITQVPGDTFKSTINELLSNGKLAVPALIFGDNLAEYHHSWFEENRNKFSEIFFYYDKESDVTKKLMSISKPLDTLISSAKISEGGQ